MSTATEQPHGLLDVIDRQESVHAKQKSIRLGREQAAEQRLRLYTELQPPRVRVQLLKNGDCLRFRGPRLITGSGNQRNRLAVPVFQHAVHRQRPLESLAPAGPQEITQNRVAVLSAD